MKTIVLFALTFMLSATARGEDVFSATELYVDLNTPFYSTYTKTRTSIGVAMVAEVAVQVSSSDARSEVMNHTPLLRDAFIRVLDRHERTTFVSAEGWELLALEATEEFNTVLAEEGCTDCVEAVLFPAGIVPEG